MKATRQTIETGDISKKQDPLAASVPDESSTAAGVFLTSGLRSDDFDTFDRATMAWLVVVQTLEFRANYFPRMTADLCAVDLMAFYA